MRIRGLSPVPMIAIALAGVLASITFTTVSATSWTGR
jgi:hypothetical protein